MIRGLLFCTIACGISAPLAAEEREAVAARTVPTSIPAAADRDLAFGATAALTDDFVVTLRSASTLPIALADFDELPFARPNITPHDVLLTEHVVLTSPFAISELRSLKAWHVTDGLPPVTTSANGFYAVRDTLGEYRRPRAFKPSPLSAMLVLRIDGKDESPAFSVGGGGVAAVLWKAMPQ
ncbi:hypothetical protein [Sphingomonas sp.]|jgi:hypothetical protein|uniref:hypothetical protein n=1 Tax=Sphingomonas sp. TaxID=28214 RepID=UPI002EDB7B38